MLGTGQLSLAKFLFITADETKQLSTHHVNEYFQYVLERIDFTRDVHFYTHTTIDTLDYSGTGLNTGSKVVFAAYGEVQRNLCRELPAVLNELNGFSNAQLAMPGVVALQTNQFSNAENAKTEIARLNQQLINQISHLSSVAIIVLCDDASFTAKNLRNFVWVTFTRCNPSHDIYGIDEFIINKHWGCNGSLIIDARIKPHHAPPVELDPAVEKRVDKLFEKGRSLYGAIK